jgi:8-oxo-dGTP pyrophosphatase MutT (NUDIX family)
MGLSCARLVVSGLIRCRDSIVVVENSSPHGPQWSAPGGKVEPGEAPIAAAIREIHEECGIEVGSPRRLVHTTYMTFAAPEGVETWLALGYEFLLGRMVDLPDWTDPDGVVSHAEWLEVSVAADRVAGSAIPPVARSFIDYCSDLENMVTRYYEFDVDLSRNPQSESTSYFGGLQVG